MVFNKILIVFGTRPEALKMIPIIKQFKKESEFFQTKVCVTANTEICWIKFYKHLIFHLILIWI